MPSLKPIPLPDNKDFLDHGNTGSLFKELCVRKICETPYTAGFRGLHGEVNSMTDIIKKTGVRKTAKDVNVGSDFYEAIDREAKELIQSAIERARANGRRTVNARDI